MDLILTLLLGISLTFINYKSSNSNVNFIKTFNPINTNCSNYQYHISYEAFCNWPLMKYEKNKQAGNCMI